MFDGLRTERPAPVTDPPPLRLAALERGIAGHRPRRIQGPLAAQRAAVAMVLRERDAARGAELLLIERAARSGDPWSGHMALPGGRAHPSDPSLEATAARETREEVGLDLAARARLLGRIGDEQAVGHGRRLPLAITPVVYALHEDAGLDPPLRLNALEVEDALWVPLGELASGRLDGKLTWRRVLGIVPIRLGCWRYEGRVIWGLTFRMVKRLLAAAAAPQG